jgi:hypothetical protein
VGALFDIDWANFSDPEKAQFLISLASLLVVFFGLFFAAVQLFQGRKALQQSEEIHRQNLDWQRKIRTVDTLRERSKLNTGALRTAFDYPRNGQPLHLDTVLDAIARDTAVRDAIFDLLNFYERIATGIETGLFDETAAKNARRRGIIFCFRTFEAYIIDYRIRRSAPRAWKSLQAIVLKWESETGHVPVFSDPTSPG